VPSEKKNFYWCSTLRAPHQCGGWLAETIPASVSGTSIIATSREVLRIDGEHVYRVPPLDVPPHDEQEPVSTLDDTALCAAFHHQG